MRRIKPPIPEPPKATKPPLPAQTKYLPPWVTGTPGPVAVVAGASLSDSTEPTEAYDFSYVHPKTQVIRRLFVSEFVKDFNGTAALARLGFNFHSPAVVATRWLKEPYTQYVLDRYIHEAEDAALITRQQVIAALNREANNYGLDSSGASRVSALGKLAKILGMEIDRTVTDVRVSHNIMLVPLAESPDDWERNAANAQLALKEEAKK